MSQEVIPKTQMAVVVHGKEDYRYEEVPVPEPGPNEVLVKVEAVGICAGDAKTYAGATRFWGDGEGVPCYVEPPVIAGHEFSGRVVKLGPGAAEKHGVKLGDLTVSEQIVPCKACKYCESGNYQMCVPHHVYGFHQVTQGAMTSYLLYPENALVHVVPDHVDPKHACFVEPFSCSLHAVDLGNIGWNDVVVISGCGPLGLGMVAGARKKDPKCIVALDLMDWKLDVAKKCGADIVLNPSKCNLIEEIMKLTDDLGCDVYIEASGAGPSVRYNACRVLIRSERYIKSGGEEVQDKRKKIFSLYSLTRQGLNVISRMGRFVEYSVFGREVTCDWSIISDTKELTIKGGHLGPYMWPKAISMIANGDLPLEEIITDAFPLTQFKKGIDKVLSGRDNIKVMLIPE